jgi:hypothetical protein
MDTTMRLSGNRTTDRIGDTNTQGSALKTVTKSQNRICRLATLTDKNTRIIAEDGTLSIEEIARQFHRDRDLCQLLKRRPRRKTGMIRRPARHKHNPPAPSNRSQIRLESTQRHRPLLKINTTPHRINHTLRLLENLLLHEMVKVALHNGRQLDFEGLNAPDGGDAFFAAEAVDVEFAIVDVGDVVVFEEEDSLGVLDDGGGVGGEEEFYRDRDTVFGEEGAGLGTVEAGVDGRVNWEGEELGCTGTIQFGCYTRQLARKIILYHEVFLFSRPGQEHQIQRRQNQL